MKNSVFILGLIGLLMSSCDKEINTKYEIFYKKYNAALVLNPADSVGQISNVHCEKFFPFPSDSTESVEIDVNEDGVNDYRFTYTTNYELISATDSCENYGSRIVMQALGIGNSILIENNTSNNLQFFELDDRIPNNSKNATTATIFSDNFQNHDNIELGGGYKYIGISSFSGGFGWIKVSYKENSLTFSIFEHASNSKLNSNIKAGYKS